MLSSLTPFVYGSGVGVTAAQSATCALPALVLARCVMRFVSDLRLWTADFPAGPAGVSDNNFTFMSHVEIT
jgi:hypothetical protein